MLRVFQVTKTLADEAIISEISQGKEADTVAWKAKIEIVANKKTFSVVIYLLNNIPTKKKV